MTSRPELRTGVSNIRSPDLPANRALLNFTVASNYDKKVYQR